MTYHDGSSFPNKTRTISIHNQQIIYCTTHNSPNLSQPCGTNAHNNRRNCGGHLHAQALAAVATVTIANPTVVRLVAGWQTGGGGGAHELRGGVVSDAATVHLQRSAQH